MVARVFVCKDAFSTFKTFGDLDKESFIYKETVVIKDKDLTGYGYDPIECADAVENVAEGELVYVLDVFLQKIGDQWRRFPPSEFCTFLYREATRAEDQKEH